MTRRQLIHSTAAAGVGTAFLLRHPLGAVGQAAPPDSAYEPWSHWYEGFGLQRAVRAAILAASPHNTQPWRFHCTADRLDLFRDRSRAIGTIDPVLREQHIGTGCALENLLLAAEANGLGVRDFMYDERPESDLIAALAFEPRTRRQSPLYAVIPHRHTNRSPYLANGQIAPSQIRDLERLNDESDLLHVQFWTGAQHSRTRDLLIAAAEAVVADREQSTDSVRWYRGTREAIELHRDGTTLDAQGMSPLLTALAKVLPEPSRSMADRVFINNVKSIYCGPGAVFGTIFARTAAAKADMARAGRLWQRMHLWATVNGIAMQPLNQIHERIDREATTGIDPVFSRDLAALEPDSDWHGVFSFRMGYGSRRARPSPRRDPATVMI